MQNQQPEVIKDSRQLHRGDEVILGDDLIIQNCRYLEAATIDHNWPSQRSSRHPDGFIEVSLEDNGKKCRKRFDLAHQTINGKPRYIFRRTDEAERIYLANRELRGDLVEAANNLIFEGKVDYANGIYYGAAKKFNDAAATDPSNAEAHSRLGCTYRKLGLWQQAHDACGRALPLTSAPHKLALIYDNMGLAKSNLGDQDGAIRYFDHALAVRPRDARVLVHRGISFEKTGQDGRAYTDTLMALKFRPGYRPALQLKSKLEASGRITSLA